MSNTIVRQPGGHVTPVDIEPKRAPLWEDDHGMDNGVMPWITSPTSPGPARMIRHEEPEVKKAPLWIGNHGTIDDKE